MTTKLPSPSDYTPDFVLVDRDDDDEPNLATGSVLTRVARRDDPDRESIDALLASYLVDAPATDVPFPSATSAEPPEPRARGTSRRDE